MLSARMLSALALAVLSGCAVSPPWPPRVDRLPEGAAGPIAPVGSVPPTLDDIVDLAGSQTPGGVIIQKLRDSRAAYALSAQQARSLAARGVPPEVVAYLRYGEQGIIEPIIQAPADPAAMVGYPYGYPHYGYHPLELHSPRYSPHWAYPGGPLRGPGYPHGGAFFGFSRRW